MASAIPRAPTRAGRRAGWKKGMARTLPSAPCSWSSCEPLFTVRLHGNAQGRPRVALGDPFANARLAQPLTISSGTRYTTEHGPREVRPLRDTCSHVNGGPVGGALSRVVLSA